MFMSQYYHTVDAKGRLIVPAKYREQLGDEFVITKGLDGCLFVYGNALAGATVCEVDKQGRILIPAVLREFAGLEKDVVLAGAGNRIEVWSSEKWAAANDDENIEEICDMEGLGI